MMLFGHAGIALGATFLLQTAINRHYENGPINTKAPDTNPLAEAARNIDYRILLIGSLLPDLIDKPLGVFIFPEALSFGRVYAHTLLFIMLLSLFGFIYYRYRKQFNILLLTFGTVTHLILDEMWLTPKVLFWPLLGFAFPREDVSNYVGLEINEVLTNSYVIGGELIGLASILIIASIIIKRKNIRNFILKGKI
jgi:inner membrane protein